MKHISDQALADVVERELQKAVEQTMFAFSAQLQKRIVEAALDTKVFICRSLNSDSINLQVFVNGQAIELPKEK